MIDRDTLELIVLDLCERRGFFSRDFRQYQIPENDMWLLCDDLIERLSISDPKKAAA